MKKLALIFLGLLLATQAYAFGKNERNALLGFGAGILVAHIVDKHQNMDSYNYAYAQPQRVVYVRESQREHHKKHYKKERKMHKQVHKNHKHCRDIVVLNHHKERHYY